MVRKILIATSTRADWGILRPVAAELAPRCRLDIVATNTHLSPRHGMTINEVRVDGFDPHPMPINVDSPADAAAEALLGMTRMLREVTPDILLLLGDRYETLAMAQAALLQRVPIAHLHGGELTFGAIDDSIRHAITKLATLHFASTEVYRRRIIRMGELPGRVFNVGSTGAENFAVKPQMSRSELEADLGWQFGENALLLTLHAETLGEIPAARLADETLAAISSFPESRVLITYPNNDPEGEQIINAIEQYAAAEPRGRVKVVPSLGFRRYHAAVSCVGAVVGNSSSGIIEVPSTLTPTVNIGNRQKGRVAAPSVIHAAPQADDIALAIKTALKTPRHRVENPYLNPGTAQRIAEILLAQSPEELRRPKCFNDQ